MPRKGKAGDLETNGQHLTPKTCHRCPDSENPKCVPNGQQTCPDCNGGLEDGEGWF